MKAINNYDKIKDGILININKTINWLNEGENFGISFEQEKDKLFNLKNNLGDSKIKIAMVGAFSEGKTTMVASWLGKVEEDMKIDYAESSDAISLYYPKDLEDKCVIIDTPGLFGNKEKETEDGIIKYKEITEKFISEAHLILYVINPVNLIKDSHKETCYWLFRELRKLENTVFVINKFDEVADLEDQKEFHDQLSIKKEGFIKTLDRFINLTDHEKKDLKIIAISANPYGEGLNNWFKKTENYESISRINDLRNVTEDVISNSSTSIYTNQINSVVSDLVLRKKNEIINILELQNQNIELSQKKLENIKFDLDETSTQIDSDFFSLKKEITTYLRRLKTQIKSADMESLGNIFDEEIGINASIVDLNLEEIFRRYLESTIANLKKIGNNIEEEINFTEKISNKYVTSLINKGLKGSGSISITNKTILASRDTLVKITNSFGGKIALKFKPWGAVNLAKNFTKALGAAVGFLTVALEMYSMWKQYQDKKKFEDTKVEIMKFIAETEDFYTKMFTDEAQFKKEYFPQLADYQNIHDGLLKENQEMRTLKSRIEKWFSNSADIQDVEYEIIN